MNYSKFHKVKTDNFWEVVQFYINGSPTTTIQIVEGTSFIIAFTLTLIGLIFLTMREFIQFVTNSKKYITSGENIMEVLIIFLTSINIILLYYDKKWAIQTGAWAVFFGKDCYTSGQDSFWKSYFLKHYLN